MYLTIIVHTYQRLGAIHHLYLILALLLLLFVLQGFSEIYNQCRRGYLLTVSRLVVLG